jgi:hypothetical protein
MMGTGFGREIGKGIFAGVVGGAVMAFCILLVMWLVRHIDIVWVP